MEAQRALRSGKVLIRIRKSIPFSSVSFSLLFPLKPSPTCFCSAEKRVHREVLLTQVSLKCVCVCEEGFVWSPEVTTEVTEQHNTTLSLPALWCLVQLKICQVSLLVSGTELFIFRSGVFLQQFLWHQYVVVFGGDLGIFLAFLLRPKQFIVTCSLSIFSSGCGDKIWCYFKETWGLFQLILWPPNLATHKRGCFLRRPFQPLL